MFRSLGVDGFLVPKSEFNPGPAPIVQWLEVSLLVVDTAYQRDIGRRGSTNIAAIAEHFDWSKFAPVIVAPVEGGRFAVVDGQHRTTAAMLRNIESVPCQVVQADRAQQAAAFAAVNGSVTKTTAQQVHFARVTAKDPKAVELEDVCAAASVEIVRRNLVTSQMRRGQTQAVGMLRTCLTSYGRDTLITALLCITESGEGNPGWLRARLIEALCIVLHGNTAWRDSGEALLRAMDSFDFESVWDEANASFIDPVGPSFKNVLVSRLKEHLGGRLKTYVLERAA